MDAAEEELTPRQKSNRRHRRLAPGRKKDKGKMIDRSPEQKKKKIKKMTAAEKRALFQTDKSAASAAIDKSAASAAIDKSAASAAIDKSAASAGTDKSAARAILEFRGSSLKSYAPKAPSPPAKSE